MDQKQIEEALKTLDLSDIAFKLSQMALKIISGKKIEEKTFSIPLSVPVELADVFQMLSDKVGVSMEDMLAHLAKEGFNAGIQNRIQQERQKMEPAATQEQAVSELEDMAKAVGFDMSSFSQKMNEFQSVVARLQDIQRMVENVDIPTTTEDSSEPVISLRPIPCPGDREE